VGRKKTGRAKENVRTGRFDNSEDSLLAHWAEKLGTTRSGLVRRATLEFLADRQSELLEENPAA
jgi:hypothetical protein